MTIADDNARLVTENMRLTARIAELEQQLASALARIAELEQQRRDPPPFVKPNRPMANAPRGARTQRASDHNRGRRREPPTRIEPHVLEHCPECNYRLAGRSIDYTRQVIDLPPPQPVEVVEHQVIKRWCPCCKAWRSPTRDLNGQILGQGRIGVRVIALIASLATTLRVPIRHIQTYLRTLHQLTLSAGAIVEVLHQVRRTHQPAIDDLKRQARASPILHGDETGWRENGQNGYMWAFSTPGDAAVRSYA